MSDELRTLYEKHGQQRVWAVIGPRGAIHFWYEPIEDHVRNWLGSRYICGVEQHNREPEDYQKDSPPSHENCWLLNAPCWHDGSSLYASEKYVPLMERCNGDNDVIFTELRREYEQRFAETQT